MSEDYLTKFEFSSKNEWQTFSRTLPWYFGLILGLFIYLLGDHKMGYYTILVFICMLIPSLILHCQYRLIDRHKAIIINHTKGKITVVKRDEVFKEFRMEHIKKVTRFKGQKDEENIIYALPTFYYNCTKIELLNGERVYFTDFITKNLNVKRLKIGTKLSPYNIILKS